MRIKSWAMMVSLLCLILLLGACSGANTPNQNASGGDQSAKTSPSQEQQAPAATSGSTSPESAAFPRTIKDANGDVTIEKQPKKVAVVHWGYADSLLLFDVPSVALALPFTEKQSVLHSESYKPYVEKVQELKIVGENTQVNMEALLDYGPDLIIAGNTVNKEILASLPQIAQTVVIDEQTTSVWSDWQSVVTKFGEILGQEETAKRYIADYQAQLQSAKEKLTALDGTVAFVQVRDKAVWLQGTNYLKPYYEGMGLKPPTSANLDMQEGAQITLEGLSVLNPDYLFLGYFNYNDKTIPALTDEWDDTAVWSKLKAVQNKHVYGINGELALGYGPIGNMYGVKAVLEALGR
ncbi:MULTISPECIES: ABC transporter substrate-binding protein [Brevibacillus]|uniref:ABC transporter substrate-binding protein n=1 Tax=Brevibacillus TaxID=55080 RepID=UPI00027199CD|nr:MULTISPECIES: ABC transporter substrate-binding protein [Brevibacillus]EJL40202.1 ABC-type Fe3+-hydroxamate transport system, periplasmic component [Brevibacillus sp. CF112]MBG9566275.1 iron ABC transporter substrate-binding protein [Brevibacillus agri]MDR9505285.1 ABC transporter substrate-binding protein [Brevibacillus agri]